MRARRLAIRVSLCFSSFLIAGHYAFCNPYGVTGVDWRAGGRMEALGMPKSASGALDPGSSWAIHWGSMHATNVPQMPRPCKPGSTCNFSSYIVATQSIYDPVQFQNWILANPGKVWVLGNEPDNPTADGDGMTQSEYTVFYHTYYTFIKSHDSTARVAVGALTGDALAGNVAADLAWWEAVLSLYQSMYGTPMPVDIWNYHCYAPPYLRNVEDYMSIYVDPFCNWVKTVDGGRFAGCEIWTTEFGIGFWHGPLNAKWVEPWMQRLCLRLEQSDVDRWFWFLGPWDGSAEGKWQETCLLAAGNLTKTVLGQTYSAMANSYPNTTATPKPDPTVLPAPAEFVDDFDDGDMSDWIDKAGPWQADGSGGYRCNHGASVPFWGTWTQPPYEYQDFTMQARVKINSAIDPMNWAGLNFRRDGLFGGTGGRNGWLVYLRQNGELGLYSAVTGTVRAVPGLVADTSQYHEIRIDVGGVPTQIDVYVDGVKQIHWFDMQTRFPSGCVGLEAGKTNITFDDFRATNYTQMEPDLENGDLEAGTVNDATPWIKWKTPASNNMNWQHAMLTGKTGRNGTVGMRFSAATAGQTFDGGIQRAVPGVKTDTVYWVSGWLRLNAPTATNLSARLGIDPTGQITDGNASSIQWTQTPVLVNSYVSVESPVVRPTANRISVWVRAGTSATQNVSIDVDDLALHQQASARTPYAHQLYH